MTVAKHVHKLKRHKFKTGSALYHCVLDNCYFKIQPQLALGKSSICWRCGHPFHLNEYSIRLAKPHCPNCQKTREENNHVVEVTSEKSANEVSGLDELKSKFGFEEEI